MAVVDISFFKSLVSILVSLAYRVTWSIEIPCFGSIVKDNLEFMMLLRSFQTFVFSNDGQFGSKLMFSDTDITKHGINLDEGIVDIIFEIKSLLL